MKSTVFEITINGCAYWGIILLLSVFLLFVLYTLVYPLNLESIKTKLKQFKVIPLLLFLVFAGIFISEIRWVNEKTVITVDDKNMIIKKYFFGIAFVDTLDLPELSKFYIRHNVPGSWHTGRTPGYGVPLTHDPTVLYFDWGGVPEKLGDHSDNFNAQQLVDEIEKRHPKKY